MSEFSERLKISDKMAEIITSAPDYLYTWLEGSAQCRKKRHSGISYVIAH